MEHHFRVASFSSLTKEVNMQPTATPGPSQLLAEDLDYHGSSHSFLTLGKLFRVKSGPPRSPTDASRPGFLRIFNTPPSPAFPCSSSFTVPPKTSRRNSIATNDSTAQSSTSGTAFRTRTLSHSISAPTLWSAASLSSSEGLSGSTRRNRPGSRLSIITQETFTESSSALDGDPDDTPLVSSNGCARRSWSPKWKQGGIFKSKSPVSNSSTSTLGSMHATTTPLRRRSIQPSLPTISCDTTPELTPPFSSSSTPDDLPPTPVSLAGSTSSLDSLKKFNARRRGNLEKLARTLGVSPGELDHPSQFVELPANVNFTPKSFAEDPSNLHPRSPGRMSLPSFVSIRSFFRPSSHNRHKSTPLLNRSRTPMPTQSIEDLHKFTFSNNLLNPHTARRMSSDPPISPIIFYPATKDVAAAVMGPTGPHDEMKHDLVAPKDQSRGVVPSLTRIKSQSRTHSRTGSGSSLESKHRRDVLFDDRLQLPEKANWLRAASPMMHSEREPDEYRYSTRDSEPTKTWSGQWNQDDMQYVIQKLRALK